jgi:predicted oxidoreductase
VPPELSAACTAPLRDGVLDQAMQLGLAVLAWSPLAGGRLASGDGVPAELVAVLDEIARREGVERTVVALAFVLSHPSRPVALVGTQRPDRVAAAVGAAGLVLDRADVYAIVQASEGVPLP